MKINLKATKGSFGDYGRVRRGTILRNLSEERAKKLIASGAYALASDEDVKAADKGQVINGLAPSKESDAAQGEDLTKLTVEQLKAHAEENGIDLGDATKKAGIIAAIQLAQEAAS